MSRSYIGANLRRLVIERANGLCEYCLIHKDNILWGEQIDHIISEKHGGVTQLSNLAFSCALCNRNKGSDLASIILQTSEIVRFFNPRTDRWQDHFKLESVEIIPLTKIGQVTARILGLNNMNRLLERQELQIVGRYPSPQALFLIK